jgi:2-polyprenyl-6-methoxyphenol hydroxylase-like FAD-dependent oxidoreductase
LVEEKNVPPALHRQIFHCFTFCLPPGEQMLAYPVAGAENSTRLGERRYNFVWYRPALEATRLRDWLTDDHGHTHEIAIPPPLIRQTHVDQIHRDAQTLLAPQLAQIVQLTPRPFFQPIYDLESTRLAFNRVTLVGDAAFTARPHLGMGVTKAAGDAVALVDSLAAAQGDPLRGLAAYERARIAFGGLIVNRARELGAYLQAQLKGDDARAAAEQERTTDTIMRMTGVPPRIPA